MKNRPLSGALLVFCAALAVPARGQEVVAVLSSASEPYQAAYRGLVKSHGRDVPTLILAEREGVDGADARVVVTFGGAAATHPFPARTTVVACLAPGMTDRLPHGGHSVLVAMKPAAASLLARLRTLQPGLKRLAVLTDGQDPRYTAELAAAAESLGIELVVSRVRTRRGLPGSLRALAGKADALWLSPDPSLVTPETFQVIKQFSWSNSVPFYAPTEGLAAAGATAAVSVSAEETGRQAAELARMALDGKALPERVYPARAHLTVNLPSAARAGLVIPEKALEQADAVIR